MLDSIDWGFALTVLGIPLCLWFFCELCLWFFCVYRNHLVFDYRSKVLDLPYAYRKYDELPSYLRMVFSPIKWSGKKLKRGPVNEKL